MREVARRAEVDPALVGHYFASKAALFLDAVELPFDPEVVLPGLVDGSRNELGRRVAEFFAALLESPAARERMTSIVRAAASEATAASLIRELIETKLLGPLARALGQRDSELRAALAGSQLVGLVMARHVVGVAPLATLPRERLARVLAPTLQRYFVEPLDLDALPPPS